jgi:RNA polymerase sigma factor (TIGR02999 family)
VSSPFLTRGRVTIPPRDISQLLADLRAGDADALEQLMPVVYAELRQLAASYLRRERPEHTLQPTALVHEMYVRLAGHVGQHGAAWQDASHFFGIAARVMRQVLVDYARAGGAAKRGAGRLRVTLSGLSHMAPGPDIDILALEAALTRLATLDAGQARLVELRFFAGLTLEEAADVLGRSVRTLKRDWRSARAWLQRELSGAQPIDDSNPPSDLDPPESQPASDRKPTA